MKSIPFVFHKTGKCSYFYFQIQRARTSPFHRSFLALSTFPFSIELMILIEILSSFIFHVRYLICEWFLLSAFYASLSVFLCAPFLSLSCCLSFILRFTIFSIWLFALYHCHWEMSMLKHAILSFQSKRQKQQLIKPSQFLHW